MWVCYERLVWEEDRDADDSLQVEIDIVEGGGIRHGGELQSSEIPFRRYKYHK
jgi:hypothetical protein